MIRTRYDDSFVELAAGKQWVQIDLEKPADISAIVVWHYHVEGRVYHSVAVQIPDDPEFKKDVKTVYNNDFANTLGLGAGKQLEYVDDYRGKAIAVKDANGGPVRGRYVRLYSNGNTSNDQNHYIEVEVYGKPVKERTSKRQPPTPPGRKPGPAGRLAVAQAAGGVGRMNCTLAQGNTKEIAESHRCRKVTQSDVARGRGNPGLSFPLRKLGGLARLGQHRGSHRS